MVIDPKKDQMPNASVPISCRTIGVTTSPETIAAAVGRVDPEGVPPEEPHQLPETLMRAAARRRPCRARAVAGGAVEAAADERELRAVKPEERLERGRRYI